MNFRISAAPAASLAALAVALCSSPAFADEGTDPLTDIIIVNGARETPVTDEIAADSAPVVAPDAAGLVARAPGAALIDNGALSGQVQYHGSFGDRVLVRIDGQRFSSGGPNLMDPPLHYAPMVLVDHIELDRGVSPVSKGPGEAGGVNAVLKHVDFTDGKAFQPRVDVGALYRSVDDSYAVGGVVGLASQNWRMGVIAAHEEGSDYRFPGGRASPTSFTRDTYGAEVGFRSGPGELSLSYRRQETGPTGNPPFPMDIVYFHTDFLRADAKLQLADGIRLEAGLGHVAVRHLMDNFSLRPAMNPMMLRATYADADTMTADAAVHFTTGIGTISLGGDIETGDKQVTITNPANPAFFIASQNRVATTRSGGFAQWRGGFGVVESEIGVRVDHYTMRAGAPELGSAVPMAPVMLANAFAVSDRDRSDTTFDVAARFWADLGAVRPRLTLARKTRVPSALERFSWLPTEASAGLADGNIYVGNPLLKPETMWIAEAGVDVETGGLYMRPTIYYRRVDDYIQGVPFDATPGVIDSTVEMVANMNGDATPLKWANVSAELYGADIDFGAKLIGPLRVDGVASYVRGKRRDIADNLYRIAPPNIRLGLTWEVQGWSLTAEGHAVAKEDKVSATNSETPTGGYVLANIYGGMELMRGVRLDAGVENLFDRYYVEHLAGYNRAAGSDVAVGARMPGTGRSAFVRLRVSY
ncbi:MAG: TonB-dependent receptor [Sphingomonadales bacterium]|nr:TonB-dependent receptor [Sphingomonadales bacterium]MBD3773943.1 TonB-dependent receptor [Paracoccaceae bacterium]